jgi:hypothetical protein
MFGFKKGLFQIDLPSSEAGIKFIQKQEKKNLG